MSFDQFYNDSRALLELLSFVANIALVLVGWKALGQLRIAKQDIAVRVEREAAIAAAAQLEVWATKIVPVVAEIVVAHNAINFTALSGGMERFDAEELASAASNVRAYNAAMVKVFEDHPEIYGKTITACNMVEASAMCFMTGVGNEEVVFTSLSGIFCEFVEWMRPLYCGMRKQGQINQWEYTVRLYRVWSQRRKKHELENQQDFLNQALAKAVKEAAPILPLGAGG